MRKRKGFAFPMAFALCTFLLIVSLSAGTILLVSSVNDIYNHRKSSNDIIFIQTYNEFVNENPTTTDTSFISDTNFNWKVYLKDENIKAIAAYSGSKTLKFYSIYDFEHDELIAYQTSSFYITKAGGYDYLGGLVRAD